MLEICKGNFQKPWINVCFYCGSQTCPSISGWVSHPFVWELRWCEGGITRDSARVEHPFSCREIQAFVVSSFLLLSWLLCCPTTSLPTGFWKWLKNSKRHHGMVRWNLTFTCVWLAGVGVSVQWVRKRTWLLQNATVRPHKTNVQVTGPLPHCLLLVQILYLQIYSKKAKSCEALFYVTSVYYSCLDSLNEQSERILPNCGKELDIIFLVASIPCAFAFLPSANTNFLHRSDSGKCQRWLVLLCLSSFIFILPVFLIIQLLSVSFSFILYNMDFLGAFDRVWQLLAAGFEMLASETIRKQHFTERSLWCLALPSELTSIFV